MKLIPYGKQYIDQDDIRSVSKVLKNEKITSGKEVANFEKKISHYLKCKFAHVCNSGTSAIFLALKSIDLEKNDIVIMPAINFIASYNVAKLLGAKVFLADVDKLTGQMTPDDVITCCKKFNIKKFKALISMYHGGSPLNAEKFHKLKKKYKFIFIEDSCHALGSSYKAKNKRYKIGCCKHSDISTFSLHPLKTITTGEGGIVTTNNKYLSEKIKKNLSHGIVRTNNHWIYNVEINGMNLRMSDFQCSLGISQLKKIALFLKKRKSIYNNYRKFLSNIQEIILPKIPGKYFSANHLFIIILKNFDLKKKNIFIKYMLKKKIVVQYHYIPIYKFKIFNDKYNEKNSNIFYKTAISLPIYYDLNVKKQKYISNCIKEFFRK
jgi:dTDP-4-amino-4,6-dideoxygalactose transaminase